MTLKNVQAHGFPDLQKNMLCHDVTTLSQTSIRTILSLVPSLDSRIFAQQNTSLSSNKEESYEIGVALTKAKQKNFSYLKERPNSEAYQTFV